MTVTLTFRENRLGTKIRKLGGIKADKAVEDAQSNLLTIRDEIVEELDRHLALINEAAERARKDEPGARAAVYEHAKMIAGLAGNGGLPEAGEAAFHLCELTDLCIMQKTWNVEAVALHLGAMALLRSPAAAGDPALRRSVLDGLAKMSTRGMQRDAAESA